MAYAKMDYNSGSDGYAGGGDGGRPVHAVRLYAARAFIDTVAAQSEVDVALRVFGHLNKNAFGTRLEVPFGEDNTYRLQSKIKTLVPNGGCTVATALTDALTDFPATGASRNIILIITDGMDDRDAGICDVARQVELSGVVAQTFVLGIGGGDFSSNDCAGSFIEVAREEDYAKAVYDLFHFSGSKAHVVVQLTDAEGRLYPTEVPLVLGDHRTGVALQTTLYSIDHTLRPDTLLLDPLMTYDLTLLTHPPIHAVHAADQADGVSVWKHVAEQGTLRLGWRGARGQWTEGDCAATVREAQTGKVAGRLAIGTDDLYLTGRYDVEVATLPPTLLRGVEVRSGSRTELQVQRPGQLLLTKPRGITTGLIIKLTDGDAEQVVNLNPARAGERLNLQPGIYEVVLRPSATTAYDQVRSARFVIESGKQTKVEF